MDFEKINSRIRERRDSVKNLGPTESLPHRYDAAWEELKEVLKDWALVPYHEDVVHHVELLNYLIVQHLGADAFDKVTDFSPEKFEGDPEHRTPADFVKTLLYLFTSDSLLGDLKQLTDLPISKHLSDHVDNVRLLIESGKSNVVCECGIQLWISEFSNGACDSCRDKMEKEKRKALAKKAEKKLGPLLSAHIQKHSTESEVLSLSSLARSPEEPVSEESPESPEATKLEESKKTNLDSVKPSQRKAYLSFLVAESVCEKRLTDHDAFKWLIDNDWSIHKVNELEGYELPIEFDTWARQLRATRNACGEQKYTPRK